MQQLYQQAKDRKLTEEYYECDIQDYLSFLSCDLNEYKETDKQLITKYLLDLKPIIPAYYKIIQEVDDSEYEIFELLNMRSQIYVDNYYDFSKVLEYASGGSNYSTGIISLETLIAKGLLPDYCVNLSYPCLHLLIHAIDHMRNRTHPKFRR